MSSESAIQHEIIGALGEDPSLRIYRANVGKAWVGDHYFFDKDMKTLTIKNPRPFSTGLPPGFSDLFGIIETRITQSMVGSILGRFFVMEVKNKKGRATEKQLNFIKIIKNKGGLAGVVRSIKDSKDLLKGKWNE